MTLLSAFWIRKRVFQSISNSFQHCQFLHRRDSLNFICTLAVPSSQVASLSFVHDRFVLPTKTRSTSFNTGKEKKNALSFHVTNECILVRREISSLGEAFDEPSFRELMQSEAERPSDLPPSSPLLKNRKRKRISGTTALGCGTYPWCDGKSISI